MNIVIIPGFIGHPEEIAFKYLDMQLTGEGHTVIKIAWPYFPDNLAKYSFTETISYTQAILKQIDMQDTVILGFSMGGIIACYLAREFPPKKLGLIVSPDQVGSKIDLAGKYKDWKEKGYREVTSSLYGNLSIPFSFVEDAKKYNTIKIIADIRCPLLFITGEKDDKNPPHTTAKLFEKANEPKIWYDIPSMEHKYQYQSPEMLEKVNKLIIKFINN